MTTIVFVVLPWISLAISVVSFRSTRRAWRHAHALRQENVHLVRALYTVIARTSLLTCDRCGITLDVHRGDPVGVEGTETGVLFVCAGCRVTEWSHD